VKQQLAAVPMLFDWQITGQEVSFNPASAVREPKLVVNIGKTPVLDDIEWPKLIDSTPTETVRDLRDRALIATLTYAFARIGAALKMKVEDLGPKGAGWQVQLHEKGGKQHVMPCHHALAEALRAYIDAAGIAKNRNGFLFRTSPGHNATVLTEQPMVQADARRMIRRHAAAAGIFAPIGNHTFRATGITAYLSNGGAFEHTQEMAAHESPRTTKLYDRTKERLLRAAELTAVWVPDETHDAVGDLVCTRAMAIEDYPRKRQHISSFLLRHGRVYEGGTTWQGRHLRWRHCHVNFELAEGSGAG
jgi:site-specific recombinase XerD